jgi:hypothetical protein
MSSIPYERSYEQVPTPTLEQALDQHTTAYFNMLDQLQAIEVSRDAIRNVLIHRRQADRLKLSGLERKA